MNQSATPIRILQNSLKRSPDRIFWRILILSHMLTNINFSSPSSNKIRRVKIFLSWCLFLQLAAEKKTPFLVQLQQIFDPSYFIRALWNSSRFIWEYQLEIRGLGNNACLNLVLIAITFFIIQAFGIKIESSCWAWKALIFD